MQSPNTISTGGTSLPADAPANVIVGPAVALAPVTVTVPGKPKIALILSLTFWLVTGVASPSAVANPSGPLSLSPILSRNVLPGFAALKLVNVIAWTSLPPCSAFWIPAGVSFWPRTIGIVSRPS